MEEDRRKFVRLKKPFTAQYYNKLKFKWDLTTLRDISENGICVNTNTEFVPGESIVIRLKFPTQPFDWVEVEAKVIESKSYLARFEFVNLKDDQKMKIQTCIKHFLTQGGTS